MSLSLYYSIDSSEFQLPSRYLEWIERIPKDSSGDCEALFGVEDVDEWEIAAPHAVASRTEMLAALKRLLPVVETSEKLFPSQFTFDFEIFPGVPVQGDTDVNSIVFSDREGFYMLSGGADRCILEKIDVTEDKQLHRSDPVDVSHRQTIHTKSHGLIKIVNRNERKTVVKYLKKLQKFLQMQFGERVEKRLA